LNILLRGVARVAIRTEHPRRLLYREVQGEMLHEQPAQRANLLESLKQFLLLIAPRLPEADAGALLRLAARAKTAGELSDGAAALLVGDPLGRQAVLETLEVDQRVDGLIAAASAALARASSGDALKQ
jgi:Lon protease-like protein